MDGWSHWLCHCIVMILAGLATKEHFLISQVDPNMCTSLSSSKVSSSLSDCYFLDNNTACTIGLHCRWLCLLVWVQIKPKTICHCDKTSVSGEQHTPGPIFPMYRYSNLLRHHVRSAPVCHFLLLPTMLLVIPFQHHEAKLINIDVYININTY